MTFPTTGIIDNFNRANEGPPLSASWTGLLNGLRVASNTAVGNVAAAFNIEYYNPATYGPDVEMYCTVNGADIVSLYHLSTATFNGYSVEYNTLTGTISVFRGDGGTPTLLGAAITQAIASGDGVGWRRTGSTIEVFYRSGAGSWVSLGTRTDTTYSQAVNLWLGISNTAGNVDDFGGGTIPPGAMGLTKGFWGN